MGRKKQAKKEKTKFENVQLIDRAENAEPYVRLERIVDRSHKSQLGECHIVLFFAHEVKNDRDGWRNYWMTKLPSKHDRQLHHQDVHLVLDAKSYSELPTKRDAMLDDALCSIVPEITKDGEHKVDSKGRKLYRLRKQVMRIFPENYERYGVWREDDDAAIHDMKTSPTLFDRPADGMTLEQKKRERERLVVELARLDDEIAEADKAAQAHAYRGFRRTKAAKVGKALTKEMAQTAIERLYGDLDAKNVGASRACVVTLDEGGYTIDDDAPAALLELRPGGATTAAPAPEVDRKLASAGAA